MPSVRILCASSSTASLPWSAVIQGPKVHRGGFSGRPVSAGDCSRVALGALRGWGGGVVSRLVIVYWFCGGVIGGGGGGVCPASENTHEAWVCRLSRVTLAAWRSMVISIDCVLRVRAVRVLCSFTLSE